MKKFTFRSPFLFLAILLGLFACKRAAKSPAVGFSDEIRHGFELEQKALAFQRNGRPDSAFHYFVEARKKYEKAADSTRIVYSLLMLGELQYQYNDFGEMQVTMVEALKYLNTASSKTYSNTIYNNLGIAYSQLENYPRAMENYKKTLYVSHSPVHKLTVQNNIANVYINSGKFGMAYTLLDAAYKSPDITDSLAVKARIADNLGYVKYKMGKTEGVALIREGLQLRELIGDRFGLATSYLHLAEVLQKSNLQSAIKAAAKAERLSTQNHSPDDRQLSLAFLMRYSDPGKAKAYSLTYLRIADSLQSARRKARNHFAEVKYNFKQEREEKLRAQANEARLGLRQSELENARLIWLVAAISVLFTSLIIVYRIVQRNRRNRWKASYEAEVRISNRLHDELANDLHQAMVFTESNDLSHMSNRDKLLDSLDIVYKRARAISRDNASVDNTSNFAVGLRELISSYVRPKQNVLVRDIDIVPWSELTEQKKVVVHRSVHELLVNMNKHSACTTALFQFGVVENTVTISYTDNGVGLSPHNVSRNGLAIMENRIRDIKGTITFGSGGGKGFRATIEFPV